MKGVFLFSCILFALYSNGQVGYASPAPARSSAYGDGTLHNALHFTVNQAALARINRFAVAVYGEKRFMLQELSQYDIALALPSGSGAFGLQVAYAGAAAFNRLKTGLAYGKSLSNRWELGMQFNYTSQQVQGYGHVAQVGVEGGMLYRFSNVLQAGFHLADLAGIALKKSLEKMPARYTLGAGYQPSQNIILTAELQKVAMRPIALLASVSYTFAPELWVQAGINSSTATFFIGCGFGLRDFSINAVGSVHPQLGLSPGLLLSYNAMDK